MAYKLGMNYAKREKGREGERERDKQRKKEIFISDSRSDSLKEGATERFMQVTGNDRLPITAISAGTVKWHVCVCVCTR